MPERRAKVKGPRETREYLWAEIDRLRAENEALREAGEGLAGRLASFAPSVRLTTLAHLEDKDALARWREVAS